MSTSQNATLLRELGALDGLFFEYDLIADVLEEMSQFYEMSRFSRSAKLLLVSGESGSGKTSVVRRYCQQLSAREELAERRHAYIYVRVPAKSTPKALAIALLRALGDPLAEKGTLPSMTNRVVGFLRDLQVPLVILDEFQDLIDRDRKKVVYETADWVKSIVDAADSAFILVGLPQIARVIAENEQLQRRVTSRVKVQPLSLNNAKAIERFRRLLLLFANELSLERIETLAHDKLVARLHEASQGLIGLLVQLIRLAGMKAARDSKPKLEIRHLAEAFESLRETEEAFVGRRNPFKASTSQAVGRA